jgi:sterol desaturase/sphingolipid hydroxylase (fatty acid hydroxylase superfamily)
VGLLELTQECRDAAHGRLALKDPKTGKPLARIQVFQSTFVERWFGQAHPLTPGILFAPIVVWGFWQMIRGSRSLVAEIGLFVFGVLLTSLIEYVLHRWLLHKEAHTDKEIMDHFLLHGYHHDFPNDPMRLVLPPIGIIPIGSAIALVWYLVFGSYWLSIYTGTSVGYVAYDWVHYYTHHFNPKRGIGKWLKQYHMLHHHDSPNHRYGITSPLWDFVFRTYVPLKVRLREGKSMQAHKQATSAP